MKVGGGHRHELEDTNTPPPAKTRYSVGMLPSVHNGKKSGRVKDSRSSRDPATKTHGLRSRLSLPASQRLQRKGTAGYNRDVHDVGVLPTILEFGLDSPIPSPVPALTPPPTIETDSDRNSIVADARSSQHCPTSSCNAATEDKAKKPKRRSSKERPPLRKRSLIYAMYCTAQPDKTSGQQCTHGSSESIASVNNGSATFVSCTSLPGISDSQESLGRISQPPQQVIISPAQYGQSQQMSDMSIGFMLVDAVEHLAIVRRQELSDAESDAGSEGTTSSSSSSSSSSRYMCAEHAVVETAAYRCSSRYAPRLSTVERAQDGRLLLKPQMDATTDIHKMPDSGNTSTAEASPYPDVPSLQTPGVVNDASEYIHNVCPENFPPMPDVSPRRRIAREPVNSLLIHASKLAAKDAGEAAACETPRVPASDPEPKELSSDVSPAGSPSPLSIITPPESPEKPTAALTDPSVDTAVSIDNSTGNSSEASTAQSDKSGNKGWRSGGLAQNDCDDYEAGIVVEHSADDKDEVPQCAVTCATDNDETDCRSELALATVSQVVQPQLDRAAPVVACPEDSGDSMTQLTDSTCGDGHLYSMFSDISDIDLRSMNLSQVSSGPWADQSLLFGESYSDTMRPRSLAFCDAPVPQHLDTRIAGNGSDSIGNSTLDDMPLAQVASLVPVAARVQQLDSHHGLLGASRTRRLTSALAKAAQLDGLRHFHRKSKHADRNSHSPTSMRRSSGSSSSSGSTRTQDKAVDSSSNSSQDKRSPKKAFRFNELVAVYETWNRDEYDRRGMPTARLDAELIEQIKQELNEYKTYEMRVHEASRRYTHFIL
ncbi:hypothetical protein LPJ63_000802 [Coemansia sp. RSA 2711]|nr:hypothetical protein LPJ63_000802 [Coemansia sp. RSA 2711]